MATRSPGARGPRLPAALPPGTLHPPPAMAAWKTKALALYNGVQN